ncbi:MAG: MBL fold metallo-hydrolase [Desulfovibrionales bacterium]
MCVASRKRLQVTFLGVGESCDEDSPNTSLLVHKGDQASGSLLLDCGFTVPPAFFARVDDPESLEAVWISHFHGDHFFGLPLLLLRLRDMGRRHSLPIVSQEGAAQVVGAALELAYPGVRESLGYELRFVVLEPGASATLCGVKWSTALNDHSQKDLALRLDNGASALFYSGDGRPTEATLDLARGCDLVVHEAYAVDGATPGHSSVQEGLDFARKAGAGRLALVHVQRGVRRSQAARIEEILQQAGDLRVVLPRPGESISI